MPHKRAKRSVRESEKEKKGQNLPPPQKSTGTSGYTDADTPKGAARIINALATRTAYHDKKRAQDEDGPRQSKGKGKASNGPQSSRNGKETLKIMPGETLGQFNRRLEDHMRPMVSQAMKDAASKQAQQEREVWQEKKKRREEAKEAKKAKDVKEQEEEGDGRRRKRVDEVVATEEDDDEEPAQDAKKRRKEPIVNTMDTPSSSNHHQPIKPKSKMDMSTGFAPIPKPPPLHDIALAPPILPGLRRSSTPATTSHFAVTGRTPLSAGQKRLMEEERERVVARYREMKEVKRAEQEAEKLKTDKGKGGKRKRPTQDA